MIDGQKVFTCPVCGSVSWSPNDLREGYCAACRDYTGRPADLTIPVASEQAS